MNPGIYGAIVASTAAAAQQEKDREEEERMTRYTPDELAQEWEFKIVRSNMDAFRNPETMQRIMQEESQAGWQLLEKLDNSRLRFKRPATARQHDDYLSEESDPYRSQVGGNPGLVIGLVLGVLILVFGVLLFAGFSFGSFEGIFTIANLVIGLAVLMAVILFASMIAVRKR